MPASTCLLHLLLLCGATYGFQIGPAAGVALSRSSSRRSSASSRGGSGSRGSSARATIGERGGDLDRTDKRINRVGGDGRQRRRLLPSTSTAAGGNTSSRGRGRDSSRVSSRGSRSSGSDRREFVSSTLTRAALAAGLSSAAVFQQGTAVRADNVEGAVDEGGNPQLSWVQQGEGLTDRSRRRVGAYSEPFVAYLARFLLAYDRPCRTCYIRDVQRAGGSEQNGWDVFAAFASSVEFGLQRYTGKEGRTALLRALRERYESEEDAPRHLALLFSLLPASKQPVDDIRTLLLETAKRERESNGMGGGGTGAESVPGLAGLTKGGGGATLGGPSLATAPGPANVEVYAAISSSPLALLPQPLLPTLDKSGKSFMLPGLIGYLEAFKRGEVGGLGSRKSLGGFGPLGTLPLQRERELTRGDYGLFAACGVLGCTATHLALVPLDVVKTRLQTSPGRYAGLIDGAKDIYREEGPLMLLQGAGATLVGYSWYGITVYPGYELFKRLFLELAGPALAASARLPLVIAAGAAATCIACIGVAPAEAVRIRQVAEPEVGGFWDAAERIIGEPGGGWGKLYEGLGPILFRQVSFGMMKFVVFDYFAEAVYRYYPYLAESTSSALGVSLVSGLVAGVASSIVSQPADTILSAMNKQQGRAGILATAKGILTDYGFGGLFLGLKGRALWAGAIISGQFLLYDLGKVALHVSPADLNVFLDALDSTIGST